MYMHMYHKNVHTFFCKKKKIYIHTHTKDKWEKLHEKCVLWKLLVNTLGAKWRYCHKKFEKDKVFTVLITQKFSCRNPPRWKKHTFPIKSGQSVTHKFVSQGHCLESSFCAHGYMCIQFVEFCVYDNIIFFIQLPNSM